MPIDIEYLDKFKYDYEGEKYIEELYTLIIINQAETLTLKDMLFDMMVNTDRTDHEKLEEKFDEYLGRRFHDLAADHIEKHGI